MGSGKKRQPPPIPSPLSTKQPSSFFNRNLSQLKADPAEKRRQTDNIAHDAPIKIREAPAFMAGWWRSMNLRKAGPEGAVTTGVSRRKWLQSFVIGGSVTLLGGAVALVRTSGYDIGALTEAKLRLLAPWQYVLVREIARRMVAPDRSEGVPTVEEVGVAEFADAYLADLRPALRRDLLRMLRFVEQLAPLGLGLVHRFTALSAPDQDRVLGSLESSQSDMLRAGFQAIKGLVMMGYYRDPRTFSILGYRGPLLAMPGQGNR